MHTFEQMARERYARAIKAARAQCEHILGMQTDGMLLRHLAEMASAIAQHAEAAHKECRDAAKFARQNGITGVW